MKSSAIYPKEFGRALQFIFLVAHEGFHGNRYHEYVDLFVDALPGPEEALRQALSLCQEISFTDKDPGCRAWKPCVPVP